jgi:hypothetical protein
MSRARLAPEGLFSDEQLLRIPNIGVTAEDLKEARESGALKYSLTGKSGPCSHGKHVQAWLDSRERPNAAGGKR